MSKKTVTTPTATAPMNTVPAALTAAPANNNFLAILAAILVGLNGQPGISVLIPSLQTLVQNAAAAANAAHPAAEATSATATATATAHASARARTSAGTSHPMLPAETYYEFMTRKPYCRFKFPGSLNLALRIEACEDFPRSARLDENCAALAAMHLTGEELEGFCRTWNSYMDTRYHCCSGAAAESATAE